MQDLNQKFDLNLIITMKIALIPKIRELSTNINYTEEWILVKTYPNTQFKIYCLCETLTKNYRIYFNIENGNIFRLGLDCREAHSESISQLKLPSSKLVPIGNTANVNATAVSCEEKDGSLQHFLSNLEFQNYNNINDWLKGVKNPEALITRATNDLIESIASSSGNSETLTRVVGTIETLSKLITAVEKYSRYFNSKIHVLRFQSIVNALEPPELTLRKEINIQEAKEYDEILVKFALFKNAENLELAERYLSTIPRIVSDNLRKTYPLPEAVWQLQQTNGYQKFQKGQFPLNILYCN